MATAGTVLRTETAHIHNDHLFLTRLLDKFEATLERASHASDLRTQLSDIESLSRFAQLLADEMPSHCRREEETVFKAVSEVSPELAEFCEEMKREHGESLVLLAGFRQALEKLDTTEDMNQALSQIQETGLDFSHSLRQHVEREESALSGFL